MALVLYFVFLKKIGLRVFSVRRFRSRLSRISSRSVLTAGTPQTFARELVQTPLLLPNNKAFFFFNGPYRGPALPADFTQVSWLSGQKNLSQSGALIWKRLHNGCAKAPAHMLSGLKVTSSPGWLACFWVACNGSPGISRVRDSSVRPVINMGVLSFFCGLTVLLQQVFKQADFGLAECKWVLLKTRSRSERMSVSA